MLMSRYSWNSVIFSSQPFALVPVAFVTNDFLAAGDDWMQSNPSIAALSINNTDVSINGLHEAAASFTRLSNSECIERYVSPLATTSSLVVVANETSLQNNGSSLIFGFISGINSSEWDNSRGWICAAYQPGNWGRYCTLDWAKEFQDDWKLTNDAFDNLRGDRAPINVTADFCLVGSSADQDSRCGLHYSSPLLIFLCVFSAVEAALVAWVAIKCHEPTHIVVGDAISNGLKHRSKSESNPIGNELVQLGCGPWTVNKQQRWFTALGKRVWIISAAL